MKAGLRHIWRFLALATLLLAMVAGTTVPHAEAAPVNKKEQTEKEKAPSGPQLRAATLVATVPGAPVLDLVPFEVTFYTLVHPVIIGQHTHADFTPDTLSYFRKLFHSSIVSKAP